MKFLNKKIVIFSITIIILIGTLVIYSLFNSNEYNFKLFNEKKNIKQISPISSKIVLDKDIVGYLTIDKIGIRNQIVKEGTNDSVLKNNIGHFSNTSRFNGNVCLAGHNYSIKESNLFRDLKDLDIGDVIVYKTEYGTRKYSIYKIDEIKSTNFKVLDNTTENIITLITCIGLRKDVRLCIKAIKIEEELNEK